MNDVAPKSHATRIVASIAAILTFAAINSLLVPTASLLSAETVWLQFANSDVSSAP